MLTLFETIDKMTVTEKNDFIRLLKSAYITRVRFPIIYIKTKSFIKSYEGFFKYLIDGCGTESIGTILDYVSVRRPVPVFEEVENEKHVPVAEIKSNAKDSAPTIQKSKVEKSTYIHTVKDLFKEYFELENLSYRECNFEFVKRRVRYAIPTNKFHWAASLECKGNDFWEAVEVIILALKKQI